MVQVLFVENLLSITSESTDLVPDQNTIKRIEITRDVDQINLYNIREGDHFIIVVKNVFNGDDYRNSIPGCPEDIDTITIVSNGMNGKCNFSYLKVKSGTYAVLTIVSDGSDPFVHGDTYQ